MTFATSIQSLNGTHVPAGVIITQIAVDWANSRAFIGNSTYVARVGLLSGAEEIYTTTPSEAVSGFPTGLDANGDCYLVKSGLYSGGLVKVSGADLSTLTSAAYPWGIEGGGGFANVNSSAGQFILDTGPGGGVIGALQQINVNKGVVMQVSQYWPSGQRSFVCAGKPLSNKGFLINGPSSSGFTQILTLSQIVCGASVSISVVGTLLPANIDAAWTQIYAHGMCVDQTDGNLLVAVSGQTPSTQNYIIKISSADASLVWKCAVPASANGAAGGGSMMSSSRIVNQKFALLTNSNSGSPPTTVTLINTSNGTSTSFTTGLAGVVPFGPQAYDDTLGAIVCNMAFTDTTGSPTRLNATPSSYTGWFVLYVDTPIPPPAQPGTPGGPATSRKRAWSYVLDGHTFYVLDLGAEGTWQYDVTTKEWSNVYTDQYVQWDVANGCMWGQRIVGGDLATTDVWEVAANNLTDNSGLFQIPHVVTGGVQTRSRDRYGCDGLLLSVSLGDLDDVAGAVVNMRFSDDNGNTWSDYFPVAMAEGDYSAELRWRSLGSFGAPGRIFEFSDSGGPRSIDGCDAFLNGFDAEVQEDS